MSAVEEPPFVAETLAWCNERRAEKELEPLSRLPKGQREDPSSCPCGKATGLAVYFTSAEGDTGVFSLPSGVRNFVCAFDDGRLPQYDVNPA